jgi:FAD/FMN-containing dehydrogenase
MSAVYSLKQKLSRDARVIIRDAESQSFRLATEQFASNSFDEEWVRNNLSPDAIVYCTCESDVVNTVKAAILSNPVVHLSARSGGHSYSGHSSRTKQAGGWVVDVSALNSVVQLDTTVLRVGAGVKLHRLNYDLRQRRLSFP